MAKVGAPSTYTNELADLICERIAAGESLRSICKDDGIPASSTIFKWLNENKEFSEQYARAREAQVEGLIDELVEIADETDQEAGAVAQSKLRIDTRKWFISKVAPVKYGESLQIGGSDALPPIKTDSTISPSDAYMAMLGKS